MIILLVSILALLGSIQTDDKAPVTCQRDFKKVGCFLRDNKVLTDLIITDLDPTHQNFSREINWDDYAGSLHSLACRCRKKAQAHYKYFGIGFFGECLAGKDNKALEKIFEDPKRSVCVNGNMGVCDNKDINECAGTQDHDYFYEMIEGDCSKRIANGEVQTLFETQTMIVKDRLVTVIPEIGMVYEIAFEVFPTSYVSGWGSVLHMSSSENADKYGARVPGIWFYPSSPTATTNYMYISNAINGKKNYLYKTKAFPLNKWIKVMINQVRKESEYVYSIYIDGEMVHQVKNTHPAYFGKVKIYAGDPWYAAQPGYIRNLKIAENCYKQDLSDKLTLPLTIPLQKGTKVGTVSKMCEEYTVSLDVNPTKYGSGWRSVFHLTIGGNVYYYGDRFPGIWYYPASSTQKTNSIYVGAGVNKDKGFRCYSKYFPPGEWVHIKAYQRKNGTKLVYTVEFNGEKACSVVNTNPVVLYGLKAFAGDPWYLAQDGSIRNIEIDGGCKKEVPGFTYLQTPTEIKKNQLLTTIKTLKEEFTINFEVRPSSFQNAWRSIICLSQHGCNTGGYGDRIPGVWAWGSNLYVYVDISGSKSRQLGKWPIDKEIWVAVKVTQRKIGNEYWYEVHVGGEEAAKVQNTKPQDFSNVKVYVGDPYYTPLDGFIRDLYIGGAVYH